MNKKVLTILSAMAISASLVACSNDTTPVVDEEKQTQEEVNQEQNKETNEQNETSKEENNGDVVIIEDNVIEVIGTEFAFEANEIVLEKGKEYTLKFTNKGQVFHDLTAPDMPVEITYMGEMPDHNGNMSFFDKLLGVKKVHAGGKGSHSHDDDKMSLHLNANSNQTVEVSFIPTEAGEYEMICTVAGHIEAGMVGKIIVKESNQ